MKVYYVTYPSSKPWCSDFTAENLAKHSKHTVIPTTNIPAGIKNSVIHFHNVQIIAKYLRPLRLISKLQQQGNKVILGLRGENGKKKYDKLLIKCDGVAVGVDQTLKLYASKLNPRVYVLPPGENPEQFKPMRVGKEFDVCWVGRDHKGFKNAGLLNKLGFTYCKATYNNYIPHEELPGFYNRSRVLIGFSDYEGFWRPCIEAALCRLPIISTPVGVVPEIVDPECIIPLPAKNNLEEYRIKIKNLLADPGFADYMGRLNYEKALKYTWHNVTPLYDDAWMIQNGCT